MKPDPAKAGRATCTFESKKGMILIGVIDVSCFGEGGKKILKKSDFLLQVPAVLIEIQA